MKLRSIVVCCCLLLVAAAPCRAGRALSIRLVHAGNKQQGSSAGLTDVMHVLRTLRYNHYRLVSSSSLRLPANNATTSLGGYGVRCSGPQNSLKITVTRGSRSLVNTTVSLRDGKPIILGGLPSQEGKLILVFVVR